MSSNLILKYETPQQAASEIVMYLVYPKDKTMAPFLSYKHMNGARQFYFDNQLRGTVLFEYEVVRVYAVPQNH